jgi:hypothetical protein
MPTPAFLKRPRFWVALVIVAWLAYVIWANFEQPNLNIYVIPWVTLQVKVSAIILGSAIIGAVLTLVIQFFWRRWRSSKNGSQSAAASAASNKTVA